MDEISPKKSSIDYIYKIIITEILCVVIILAAVIVVKYAFKDTYKELKEWYETYICDETSIDEVLKEGDYEV